jgi:hypothetical protein
MRSIDFDPLCTRGGRHVAFGVVSMPNEAGKAETVRAKDDSIGNARQVSSQGNFRFL